MNRIISTAAAFVLAFGAPASADPSFGVGLSVSFGSGETDYGIGVRVFSDDKPEEFVASAGIDYMFRSRQVRPTIGAAYLWDNTYIGLDLGFGLNGEGIDFGVGVGAVNTDADKDDDPDDEPTGDIIDSPSSEVKPTGSTDLS